MSVNVTLSLENHLKKVGTDLCGAEAYESHGDSFDKGYLVQLSMDLIYQLSHYKGISVEKILEGYKISPVHTSV